ncbi:uncharacterized protein LOC131939629 [Physella acuta]|uniref:uncharacterized protein LOC131939629 n=1 Tax=Physella acuta TaxID=109671 RepID=UPI0027DE64B4|nr:uncharacterized protein LOC131939629 [Physella acuta]
MSSRRKLARRETKQEVRLSIKSTSYGHSDDDMGDTPPSAHRLRDIETTTRKLRAALTLQKPDREHRAPLDYDEARSDDSCRSRVREVEDELTKVKREVKSLRAEVRLQDSRITEIVNRQKYLTEKFESGFKVIADKKEKALRPKLKTVSKAGSSSILKELYRRKRKANALELTWEESSTSSRSGTETEDDSDEVEEVKVMSKDTWADFNIPYTRKILTSGKKFYSPFYTLSNTPCRVRVQAMFDREEYLRVKVLVSANEARTPSKISFTGVGRIYNLSPGAHSQVWKLDSEFVSLPEPGSELALEAGVYLKTLRYDTANITFSKLASYVHTGALRFLWNVQAVKPF